MIFKWKFIEKLLCWGKWGKKNLVRSNLDMFVWTSGFHNPLAHTHFNMFVDEWTSANESPVLLCVDNLFVSFVLFCADIYSCHLFYCVQTILLEIKMSSKPYTTLQRITIEAIDCVIKTNNDPHGHLNVSIEPRIPFICVICSILCRPFICVICSILCRPFIHVTCFIPCRQFIQVICFILYTSFICVISFVVCRPFIHVICFILCRPFIHVICFILYTPFICVIIFVVCRAFIIAICFILCRPFICVICVIVYKPFTCAIHMVLSFPDRSEQSIWHTLLLFVWRPTKVPHRGNVGSGWLSCIAAATCSSFAAEGRKRWPVRQWRNRIALEKRIKSHKKSEWIQCFTANWCES